MDCNWSFTKSMCWFAVSMFVLREGNDKERDGIQRLFWRSSKMFKRSTKNRYLVPDVPGSNHQKISKYSQARHQDIAIFFPTMKSLRKSCRASIICRSNTSGAGTAVVRPCITTSPPSTCSSLVRKSLGNNPGGPRRTVSVFFFYPQV